MINIALPKGRLGEKVYQMLLDSGYACPDINENTRKLVFEDASGSVRYFWVKPTDVPIYVERGVADIGVAGKDIILEKTPDVYELIDLNIGKCKMAVAAKVDFFYNSTSVLKVATKFPNIAKQYYSSKSKDIDIIELHGSIELAPLLGLSDVIVDIVETGKTLKENGLEVKEIITPISARLISNKSAYKFKYTEINSILKGIKAQVKNDD